MAIKTAISGLDFMGRRMLEHMQLHDGWDSMHENCRLAENATPGSLVMDSADKAVFLVKPFRIDIVGGDIVGNRLIEWGGRV